MNFTEWLETITSDSQSEVAKKIGMSRRTLQNQLYGTPKAETVIKIADEYGVNPHRALTELGYVEEHWLEELIGDIDAALLAASEPKLSDEVLRRMLRGVKTEALTTPVSELPTLRAVESTPDVQPEPYAAKRKKPEPSEGDDDYGPGA